MVKYRLIPSLFFVEIDGNCINKALSYVMHHSKGYLGQFSPKSHNPGVGARLYCKHLKKIKNFIVELLHDRES
jgi:hypothetical protein